MKQELKQLFLRGCLLDGAMGSRLIGSGISDFERASITDPQLVREVHRGYLQAGSDVIFANTFGANPIKRDDWREVLSAACELALSETAKLKNRYCLLDMGPSGKIGCFDEFYDCFYRTAQAAKTAGVHGIVIETFMNMTELRAAIIAAKESGLFVAASMSFEQNLRTAFGVGIESFAAAACALGADAVGINCSLGPDKLLPHVKLLSEWADAPIFVKPNAGIPQLVGGVASYDMDANEFFRHMSAVAGLGINAIGGCCGTTDEYISLLRGITLAPKAKGKLCRGSLAGSLRAVRGGGLTVGERINPTGKPAFKQALLRANYDYILGIAEQQQSCGADILDVNLGFNEIDETAMLPQAVKKLSAAVMCPLCIDTSSSDALERALRECDGKPLINSFSAKPDSAAAVLPLAKKYGAAVIGLCLDENGIPETADGRLRVAKKLIDLAKDYGLPPEDLYVDTLCMAESAGRGNAVTTLKTLQKVKALGVKTVLGVSNVSFGMPQREDINAAFLALAQQAGLDLAIINPSLIGMTGSAEAYEFLSGAEGAAQKYIAKMGGAASVKPQQTAVLTLYDSIVAGRADDAERLSAQEVLRGGPSQVIENHVIPALDKVGADYERGVLFLPQLLSCAEAAKRAFIPVKAALGGKKSGKGKFVIATVEGDIHDIGKNIVAAVAENYGFEVYDLGKNVPASVILDAVRQHYPCAVGLSALMTTTACNMKPAIDMLRAEYPEIHVLLGGAVLSEGYARSIGGTYCRDAQDTVKKLRKIFEKNA